MTGTTPDVLRGNSDSPVAVCTLSSHDLLQRLARSPIVERIAMLGPLETENLGIERMLTECTSEGGSLRLASFGAEKSA